jgi:hypothetical protein
MRVEEENQNTKKNLTKDPIIFQKLSKKKENDHKKYKNKNQI